MEIYNLAGKTVMGFIAFFILNILVVSGCAETKPERPFPLPYHPDPESIYKIYGLDYIYPVSPAESYAAILREFKKKGFLKVDDRIIYYIYPDPSFEDSDAISEEFKKKGFPAVKDGMRILFYVYYEYRNLRTDSIEYEEKGKKYSTNCEAKIFTIPDYPNYSKVSMYSYTSVYKTGIGEWGPHEMYGLFDWKKDWYSVKDERDVYAAEDMLELLREELGLKRDEVIRPCVSLLPPDLSPFIEQYEAEKAIKEKKTEEVLFYTDQEGYTQNMWHKVRDTDSRVLFDKSRFKAKNYLHGGRVLKTEIIVESETEKWTNIKEHYFYGDGRIAYFLEKQITSKLLDTRRYKKLPAAPYILERRKIFDKAGKEIKLDPWEREWGERAYSTTQGKIYPDSIYVPDLGIDLYRDVNSLPFSKMLKE